MTEREKLEVQIKLLEEAPKGYHDSSIVEVCQKMISELRRILENLKIKGEP